MGFLAAWVGDQMNDMFTQMENLNSLAAIILAEMGKGNGMLPELDAVDVIGCVSLFNDEMLEIRVFSESEQDFEEFTESLLGRLQYNGIKLPVVVKRATEA